MTITSSMTLTGFNQEGRNVTGNIEKLFLEKIPDKYYDRRFEGFKLYNEEGQ